MRANPKKSVNYHQRWLTLTMLIGFVACTPLAAEAPKSNDTPTGGGMGGTGNTTESERTPGLLPLNDQKAPACSQEEVVGEYLLDSSDSNAQGRLRSMQTLCFNVHFNLEATDRLKLNLKTGQKVILQSKGNGTVELKRSTGKLGAQLEISVHATNESFSVTLNQDLLVIQEGYVGRIWIDGVQMFWGLRLK